MTKIQNDKPVWVTDNEMLDFIGIWCLEFDISKVC